MFIFHQSLGVLGALCRSPVLLVVWVELVGMAVQVWPGSSSTVPCGVTLVATVVGVTLIGAVIQVCLGSFFS